MSMLNSSLNAKRFAGKPLRQPIYQFSSVEKCAKDLNGSLLCEVTERQDFIDATAEMVLLCKEAMKRSPMDRNPKRVTKPLSLEYLADRFDIDDPIMGLFVRDQQSRLQGFVTCTTFTNWQKSFRWDSMHRSAFGYDDNGMGRAMLDGTRKFDEKGELAAALQSTIRCGDPYNEGIVWPRIAEISLLGGLGCGRTLLSLMIEHLETSKTNRNRNYDYVVLQATENSIPFYESMGFVRVGALTKDEKFQQKQETKDLPDNKTKRRRKTASNRSSQDSESSVVVSSPTFTYSVRKNGETPLTIAKKCGVDVWDIIFLNDYVYPNLQSRSWLYKDTKIFVPDNEAAIADATALVSTTEQIRFREKSRAPKWYLCEDNDTPKSIAKKFGLDPVDIVQGNSSSLPALQTNSKLKELTRIRVSHFTQHEDVFVPYCHWSFPDDSFDNLEPSYMMARKLNRRPGARRRVETSLATPVNRTYVPPPAGLFATVEPQSATKTKKQPEKKSKPKANSNPKTLPEKPKRPSNPFFLYFSDVRESVRKATPGIKASELSKLMAARWSEMPEEDKSKYVSKHEELREKYQKELVVYKRKLKEFCQEHPEMPFGLSPSKQQRGDDEDGPDDTTLFNKVIKLKRDAISEASKKYKYFYVLTYIPDLQWCHLAPMVQTGQHWDETEFPECDRRPMWRLVEESQGQEVDISSSFCEVVKSFAVLKKEDADDERWDICESDRVSRRTAESKKNKNGRRSTLNACNGQRQGKRKCPGDADTPIETEQKPVQRKRGKVTAQIGRRAVSLTPTKRKYPNKRAKGETSRSVESQFQQRLLQRGDSTNKSNAKATPVPEFDQPKCRTRESSRRKKVPHLFGDFLESPKGKASSSVKPSCKGSAQKNSKAPKKETNRLKATVANSEKTDERATPGDAKETQCQTHKGKQKGPQKTPVRASSRVRSSTDLFGDFVQHSDIKSSRSDKYAYNGVSPRRRQADKAEDIKKNIPKGTKNMKKA